jgi:hypothetical protein
LRAAVKPLKYSIANIWRPRSSVGRRRAGRPRPGAARAGGRHSTAMRERTVVPGRHHAGSGCESWVQTQLSPSIRARTLLARPPETVQSRSGHVSCGTSFVAVAEATLHKPYAQRACDAPTPRAYATFRIAPAGTTPLVTYRQSAITSLRATATIPIRRARLPRPKFARYHCVSALWGCHRTQFQAS